MADVLTLLLTDSQAALFTPLLELQRDQKALAIFAVVATSFDSQAGQAVIRLQAKSVPWKVAKKVVKILRSADGRSVQKYS